MNHIFTPPTVGRATEWFVSRSRPLVSSGGDHGRDANAGSRNRAFGSMPGD